MQIDELWQQVCEAPHDAELRRILADALLDAGDPRGELIQLQSLPLERQTYEVLARCDELIAEHWYPWLGVVADVLDREGTYFRHGFLDEIVVRATPAELARVRGNRELHTVRAVRPGYSDHAQFIRFVAELPYEPVMLELRDPSPELAAVRAHWRTRGLTVRFIAGLADLAPTFPDLEQLELSPLTGWDPIRTLDLLPRLPGVFPRLTSIVLDCRVPWFWYPGGDPGAGEALLASTGANPLVTIRR